MQKRVWTEPTHVAQHKSRDGLTLAFDSISSDLNTEAKHCRMQNAASSYIWARRGSLRFEYENVISKFAVWQEVEAYSYFADLLACYQWDSHFLTKNEKNCSLVNNQRWNLAFRWLEGDRLLRKSIWFSNWAAPTVKFPDVSYGPTLPFFFHN